MTDEARMIAEAFRDRGPFVTKPRTVTDGMNVWLHKNLIAWRDANDIVWVTLAGWPTSTTRDRVNAILNAVGAPFRIYQHKGEQFIRFLFIDTHVRIASDEHLPVTDLLGMMAHRA